MLHAALHQYEDSNAINHQPMDLHSETIKERVLTYSPDIERQIAQIEEKLASVSDNPRLSAIEWLLKMKKPQEGIRTMIFQFNQKSR